MSLVGKDGAQAAWMLVLHAVQDLNFMSKCLNLMRRAVLQGEAERWCLAYLEDRVLLLTGKQQKYGTQFLVNAEGKTYPLNLREPEKVNWRRRQVGLEPIGAVNQQLQWIQNFIFDNRLR